MAKKIQLTDAQLKELVVRAATLAEEKKAIDIKILDLREMTSITDYFIICTGEVNDHVKAIVKSVEKGLIKEYAHKAFHIEGYNTQNWVIIDYFDFIVHVFNPETREYYNLEKLWADAPVIEF
jgi:ribosome-associated protein